MNALALRTAWLSGLWDGEGSIGLTLSRSTLILQCQMSHTHEETLRTAQSVMDDLGVASRGPYTFKEKKAHHKPAWIIHAGGIGNSRLLAESLLPYAVTKRRHWELVIRWADRRIEVAGGLDEHGRLRRGGIPADRLYSEADLDVARELRSLNRPGRDQSALDRLALRG